MSWKSVGGINYNKTNMYVRATNFQVDYVVPTQSIGKKDTTAYVEGDLFFQDGIKLYSTRNEIDSNGLYAHYPFNSIVASGDYIFYNESNNINIDISASHLKESKVVTIDGNTYSFAENTPKLYIDLSYGNTLHLEPRSSLLYTDASFNPSQQITNDVLADEFKAMTMNCWIKVKTPTTSTPNTGFLLFGLDTINLDNTRTESDGRSRIDGQIDHLNPSFYFFCPGYGHADPQVYWTEDVSNAMLGGNIRGGGRSVKPLIYDSWNMITIIVRNREVELYRNGELSDTFPVSGRMPNNKYKVVINGNRFYDSTTDTWITTNYTSEHDVKIIDYKIFNYACHSEYISLLYKHYASLSGIRADNNLSQIHSKTAFNYYIDPSFSLLKSTLFVQGDVVSIGKHEIFNKQIVYGPSEIVNDAYVEGTMGIGVIDPDEKLDVRGNIKTSGNLYLGFEDISVNGIYFKGYTGDVDPNYKHTTIEEKSYIDPADGSITFPYENQPPNTELFIFKGKNIHENKQDPKTISLEGSITDASWNNTQGDRIRLKAPNILFDTYNTSNTNISDTTARFEETHGMIFDQSGNLGIHTLYAKQRLDVRGKINVQTDDRYDISSNIYISNTSDPDPLNKGRQNTGLGGNIFSNNLFNSFSSTAIGYKTQHNIEDGYENTSVGHSTLTNNVSGYRNVAIGNNSLKEYLYNNSTSVGYNSQTNTTTGMNVSLGHSTLANNTTGTNNIAIGNNSMLSNNGNYNLAIGFNTLTNNDGSGNIAIGNNSQHLSSTPCYRNTSIGINSLNTTKENDNTAIGYHAMYQKSDGSNNIAIGSMSLELNSQGNDNVSLGFKSMNNTTSSHSISIGSYTLEKTTSNNQVAIGYESQNKATTASGNVTVGTKTLKNNIYGSENVAVGHESQTAFIGDSNSHNTSVGFKTLNNNTIGKYNTAIGHESQINVISADYNTSVGTDSLHENIANLNNAFGANSLYYNYDGINNTAFGSYALYNSVSGTDNIAIGNNSSYNNKDSQNISIGNNSQYNNNTGHNNLSLGNYSMYTSSNATNSIAIGYKSQENTLDASSNISIGNYSLQNSRIEQNDNIAIGYQSMKQKLRGNKNIAIGSYSYSNYGNGIANPQHDGDSNIVLGYESMMDTSSNMSIVIGNYSLKKSQTDSSIAIGHESQYLSTSADKNTSIGHNTLHDNISGNENTSVGYQSQYYAISADCNTSLGHHTLFKNIVGSNNTAIGHNALKDASGNITSNTAVGVNTLKNIIANTTGGRSNIAIGGNAMMNASSGDYNVSIGDDTLLVNEIGSKNISIGHKNLTSNTEGTDNVSIGYETLFKNTTGINNTGVGNYALHENSSGNRNTCLGYQSLYNVTSGNNNVAVGYQAQYLSNSTFNTSIGDNTLSEIISAVDSSYNTAVGYSSLYKLKTGGSNTAIGYYSLGDAVISSNNIAIGISAVKSKPTGLQPSAGHSNIGIGNKSLYNIIDSSYNIGIGEESMYNLNQSTYNVALGYRSLYGDSTNGFSGNYNVSIGYETLKNANTAEYNTSIGYNSLYYNTTGNQNISLGYKNLHDNESGSNNISLGYKSLYSNIDTSSNIALGSHTLYYNKQNLNIAIGDYSQYKGITGQYNTSIGVESLKENQYGSNNTAMGWKSQELTNGTDNTTQASNNSSFGYMSLNANTTGEENVAVGSYALEKNGNNDYNVAVGYQALQMDVPSTSNEQLRTARGNTAVGYQSMKHHYYNNSTSTTEGNTAVGYKSLHSEHSGILQDNVAVGSRAMLDVSDNSYRNIAIGNMSLTSGKVLDNIAIGDYALARENIPGDSIDNTQIKGNVAIGTTSLYQDVSGNYNVAIGHRPLYHNHAGHYNVALGVDALYNNNKSSHNIAIGNNALHDLSISSVSDYNVSIGKDSFKSHLDGQENIVIGHETAYSHKQGDSNVYIGTKSAYLDISGNQNTVIGHESMYNNTDGKGNSILGWRSGYDCKGNYNVIIGYEADVPGSGNTQTDDDNGFGEYVDYSIAIGYNSSVKANQNIAIGNNASIDFMYNGVNRLYPDVDVNNSIAIGNNSSVYAPQSIAIGNNSSVNENRSTAIGVDASSNMYSNTIVIGETIPYKWLKPDWATNTTYKESTDPNYTIQLDKYNNPNSDRTFNDTVKVCIGTQDYKGADGFDYKFRVDGSANITGDLKVDGNIVFTGNTIETIDHQVIRMSEQVDISNTGLSPALKITQYGINPNKTNDPRWQEGSIIQIRDGDDENNGSPSTEVFHIKNGGNTFIRNNLDISRNVIIYNKEPGEPNIRDPNEADPSFNHFTIGSYPGYYSNHNATMVNTRDFQDTINVHNDIQNSYPSRPTKYLPSIGGVSHTIDGRITDYKIYDFAGGRSNADKNVHTKGQYSFEVSGNVFIHDYMKIESGRPFENSLDIHTTDGIQLPCGTSNQRPGNYYYHDYNPDPNINESVYPKTTPNSNTSTQRYQVNNFTGNSSDGSIRYNTDTSQCEVYAGGNMWTGLAGYKTEQPPYLFKYDLGQSQTTSIGDLPIKHNGNNLSIEKTAFAANTAWRQLTTIYYDSFTGLPYPLYHYTIIDISTNSGWQLFTVLNGNVDEDGNETTPNINYNFDGRLARNSFTTKTLAELPPYPEKPNIEPNDTSTYITKNNTDQYGVTTSVNVPFYQNGFFNMDPDLSYNVRVYALNKSRKKPNFIYLNNLFLLRVAYPDIVNFAFNDTGILIDNKTYYNFQEFSQYAVKMNLSFERANIDNIGSTNDNKYITDPENSSLKIFDPNSTSYPSITHYNVQMYATSTKCFFSTSINTKLGNGYKNTLTTSIGSYVQDGTIVDNYGSSSQPNTYQIVNELTDLEQKNVQFQHTLLPGTKYTVKFTAKNNRNPYFSHTEQAQWDPTTVDLDNISNSSFQPTNVTIGGEFQNTQFTEMSYYTNADEYIPPTGTEDPLYVKYISNDDLIPLNLSTITFGGHRTIAVFDPDEDNHYKYIPYFNQYSSDSWGTGKYFDISGEENFYVNFHRQGINCFNIPLLAHAILRIQQVVNADLGIELINNDELVYSNSSTSHFINHNARNIQNGILRFDTTITESASADINKGFVRTANFKIIPSTSYAVGTQGTALASRNIYSMTYEINAPVSRDATNNNGFLDASYITQRTSVSPYQFYVDNYNSSPTKTSTGTITVNSNNLLFCMGIPSSKLVSLNVNYTISNYAKQFLPAIETIDDNGTIKTLISRVAINSIGVNSQRFGSQQDYDTDDIKNFIGINDNYTTFYNNSTPSTASWPNLYFINNSDSIYYNTSTTDLTYKIIAYHLSNNTSSTYDNLLLTSNEETNLYDSNTDKFTPAYPIWCDRKSFIIDSNGVISTTLNSEVLNTYTPIYTTYGAAEWGNDNMHISNLRQDNPTSNSFFLHNRQLLYFDGKFGTPTHFDSYNFSPYNATNVPTGLNGRDSGNEFTWVGNKSVNNNPITLDNTDYALKYVIFKIPASQHITDTGLVDISNLLINGQKLDTYISSSGDGTWPATLDGIFIWVAQEYYNGNATETYYGSVNKVYDPIETNWYLNPNNKNDIVNAYNSQASARSIDNPHYIRINTDNTDQMYLIVGLDIDTDVYVNFSV